MCLLTRVPGYSEVRDVENRKMTMNRKTIITFLLMLMVLPISAQKLIATKTTIDVGKTGFQQPVTAVFEFQNKGVHRLMI
jgi:hypothetical protein